jgi:hypothetical protein
MESEDFDPVKHKIFQKHPPFLLIALSQRLDERASVASVQIYSDFSSI